MQNTHIQWRLDFARGLAEKIAAFPGVRAIVVAGSVARGYADAYSDLELPIFWDALPDDAGRHAVVDALGADFLYGYDGPSAEDQLMIDGLQVDVWHISVAREESVIKAVLEDHACDLGALNAMDTLRSCIPLYGHDFVAAWKECAQVYPEALAEKIIRQRMLSFRIAELLVLASRDNPTAFYGHLSYLQQELFLVLLALNRQYFPTFKWLFRALVTMQVKPEHVDRRLRQAFEQPCFEAVAGTQRLLEETLTLVEQQFPHLDTTQAHRRLEYRRAEHSNPGVL